jgi:hypothetical protein
LLTVIRSHVHLPEKYLPNRDPPSQSGPFEIDPPAEDEIDPILTLEPDPSMSHCQITV